MRIDFTLDPNIIHHIIHSQAGSIGKALIELIMNSIDAHAKEIRLSVSPDGFDCVDDGHGFSSRQEVLDYFGRFGTPHVEGDATFGRFRLGRGQIMAHAKTVWRSHHWEMTVDTKTMGYAYDLEDCADSLPGCAIRGVWYERLSQTEYFDLLQEIRDLVRYTPVPVFLQGVQINRLPQEEPWDHEDQFAWYRVREEGSVAIFNQGILVRHDASHLWGAGGLIVSKNALGLNVSRTEILRKTDPVWKPIEAAFRKLANKLVRTERRNTEAWRTHCARLLISGATNDLYDVFRTAPIITVLPGKRHITVVDFLRHCQVQGVEDRFTLVQSSSDIPLAESVAFTKAATVLHPMNLDRFQVFSTLDFLDALNRILQNILELEPDQKSGLSWHQGFIRSRNLQAVDFALLREHFQCKASIVSEKRLGKEKLRAWRGIKAVLEGYACLCAGGEVYKDTLRPRYGEVNAPYRFQIFLGESDSAEAWTDGSSYIAINIRVLDTILSHPLRTLHKLFSLVEHESAHQGDSVGAGHDLEFYERFHDISQRMAEYRHRYVQFFLRRYSMSLARAASRSGKAKKAFHVSGEVDRYWEQAERVQRDSRALDLLEQDFQDWVAENEEMPEVERDKEVSVQFRERENQRLRQLILQRTGKDPEGSEIDWDALVAATRERQREEEEGWRQWEEESLF